MKRTSQQKACGGQLGIWERKPPSTKRQRWPASVRRAIKLTALPGAKTNRQHPNFMSQDPIPKTPSIPAVDRAAPGSLEWLQCSRKPCSGVVVGVYAFERGCACDDPQVQALCAQHLVKVEPCGEMRCLVILRPVAGFPYRPKEADAIAGIAAICDQLSLFGQEYNAQQILDRIEVLAVALGFGAHPATENDGGEPQSRAEKAP